MKGGQNRKPDSVKALQGTLEKSRVNPSAPKLPKRVVPPPPAGLNKFEKAAWEELRPQLDALGVFTVSDFSALKLLSQSMGLVAEADGDMPASARVRLMQVAASLLQRFGLDPASRGRVSVAPSGARDEPADFFFSVVEGGKK